MADTLSSGFEEFLKTLTVTPQKQHFLLAVSGGPDSMAMTHLFFRAGLHISVVHCNFGLRAAESDREEMFVKEWMSKKGIPVYTKKFNTRNYADERGVSIQLAARELRYEWFEELRQQIGAQWIATAHHLDDSRETLLINLLRGTGIAGLAGIPARTGNIVRPLLFATRQEIEEYLQLHEVPFVTDSSNLHTDYLRNQLRLEIIPALRKVWPGWDASFADTLSRLSFAAGVFRKKMQEEEQQRFVKSGDAWHINISDLTPGEETAQLLYELLKNYGFNLDQTREIAKALSRTPGRLFLSNTHRITIERGFLELSPLRQTETDHFAEVFPETQQIHAKSFTLSFSKIEIKDFRGFTPGNSSAWFDYHKLSFPLIVRPWHQGDRIQPLGMKGWQKISDLFVQAKLSRTQKESLPLLCCGDEVIWVPGLRSSEKYKVDSHTRLIFRVDIMPTEKTTSAAPDDR
ncbi:MAG: tRNA lysidine(34) synthetase TilS [Bacteroidales bacterium]